MKETDGHGRLKDPHGDVHYHNHFTVNFPEVALINAKLEVIDRKQDLIMSKADDLKADIAEIVSKLDETDQDIDTLIALVKRGSTTDGLTAEQTEEVAALLSTVKARVSATAAKYPAEEPPTPA